MSRYCTWFLREVKQSRARLVRGWMSVTDRGLSRMHGFSMKVRVTLTDEWPDDFRKVGIVTLTPTLQGHGRLNILCFWTGHNVSRHDGAPHVMGRHRRTGTASKIEIAAYKFLWLYYWMKYASETHNALLLHCLSLSESCLSSWNYIY